MHPAVLEIPGLGSIHVSWQFDGNVLYVQGSGKNLRIDVTDVHLVKYPARNKALILFGNAGEQKLQIEFPNIKGLLHSHWGRFPEQEFQIGRFTVPLVMFLGSGLALVIGGVLIFYFWGIPFIARKAVELVPVEQEVSLGKEISMGVFMQTPPDSASSALLNRFAAEIDFASHYPLHFNVIRDSTVNAFALPGGEIVVYSGIIDKLNHSGQLAALLAHEASHVNYRHSLHGIMDKVLWSALLALIMGDGGLISAISAQGNEFRSLAYSRDLETQADTAGAGILRRNGIEVRQMLSLLKVLQQESAHGASVPEFLQTHPLPESRMEEVKILAESQVEITAHPQLDSLFGLLKTELK
jgi:Zn-dependent protease with chaperone function